MREAILPNLTDQEVNLAYEGLRYFIKVYLPVFISASCDRFTWGEKIRLIFVKYLPYIFFAINLYSTFPDLASPTQLDKILSIVTTTIVGVCPIKKIDSRIVS